MQLMDRVTRIDAAELESWSQLSAEARLRQANAALRLFQHLHRPFSSPYVRGFDTLEEFFQFEKEAGVSR